MSPFPDSSLEGHRRLHDRALGALQRCQESQDVDFKESAPWESLKWRVIHTCLGMGNLRDGGLIVIGVSERNASWELTGISATHLATYAADTMLDQINAYVSPVVELDIVILSQGTETYLVVGVREFAETPLVCKKNGPTDQPIVKGAFYVRPPGMPRTTRITEAAQMHDLLELAAEKRAKRILETSRRIGALPIESPGDPYQAERGDL